jgi:3-phosphoshikimate 1-carboxyvinyltransferase
MSMATRALRGVIRVPSDKSLSHRVALFSALAEGTSRVRGLLNSLDVCSTLGVVEKLGAKVDLTADDDGRSLSGTITGWGAAGPSSPETALQCGNSGTTARLLLGALSGYDVTAFLAGDESLSRRPMNRVTLPLSKMGARFNPSDVFCRSCISEPFDTLPMRVRGSASLKAIQHKSPVASAQVKTAVLLAGLRAQGTTSVTEPYQSRNHTELLLPAYGAPVAVEGLTASINGEQYLRASDCAVPGDPSSAAFLLVAAALIPGSELEVRDVLLNPTRIAFLTVMQRMGADIAIEISKNGRLGEEQVGSVTLRHREGLTATVVEAHEVPALIDEVPILALLATAAQGTTVFEQVSELRVKESDRLAAIIDGLTALGCIVYDEGDNLHVTHGPPRNEARVLETHGDHRLAMTWAIAARTFGLESTIRDPASVQVSYPGFFDDLRQLGTVPYHRKGDT